MLSRKIAAKSKKIKITITPFNRFHDLAYDTHISIGLLIVGMVISLLIAKVLQFFCFNVDYSRTEYVQFEDDEYYYYVKAVPKNSVAQAKKKVKKIIAAKLPQRAKKSK